MTTRIEDRVEDRVEDPDKARLRDSVAHYLDVVHARGRADLDAGWDVLDVMLVTVELIHSWLIANGEPITPSMQSRLPTRAAASSCSARPTGEMASPPNTTAWAEAADALTELGRQLGPGPGTWDYQLRTSLEHFLSARRRWDDAHATGDRS